MKKKLLFAVCIAATVCINTSAQGQPGGMSQRQHTYVPFVRNETNQDSINWRNEQLTEGRGVKKRGFFGDLAKTISTSYKTTVMQKTVNATSNLVSFGVNLLSTWINRNKTNREAWLKAAKAQCHFEKNLGTQTFIDDFYYDASKNGALDPLYMKFNGFGCKGYLKSNADGNMGKEVNNQVGQDVASGKDLKLDSGQGNGGKPEAKDVSKLQNAASLNIPTSDDKELWEFYVTCKLRTDSVGLNHIANHSKFYVELDTFVLDTRHLSLPNDSTNKQLQQKFDFDKRKDLTFRINVKVYSSWVNEAIMLNDNQQIGEFNITAKIQRSFVKDSVFVFDKTNPEHVKAITVDGDCFLVPRSYTGTAGNPSWGTGQYRLDMTVYETCDVNEEYYQIKTVGNGKQIAADNTPGKTKWDKKKWQAEWNEMKQRQKGASVWKNMWNSITTAYIGSDWVQELVSPAANAVYDQEAVSLNDLFKLNSSSQQEAGNGQTPVGDNGQTKGDANNQVGHNGQEVNNGQVAPTQANGQGINEGASTEGGMPKK